MKRERHIIRYEADDLKTKLTLFLKYKVENKFIYYTNKIVGQFRNFISQLTIYNAEATGEWNGILLRKRYPMLYKVTDKLYGINNTMNCMVCNRWFKLIDEIDYLEQSKCNSHDIYKEEFFDEERNGWVS